MKKAFFLICISLVLSCKTESKSGVQDRNQFSKEAVLADLNYLKTSLEKTHINLYAYTSKTDFEKNYDVVKSEIRNDSLSLLETIKLFQRVASKANNGHTRIPFPVQSYIKYMDSGGTIFPLEVTIENGITVIRKNWSKNSNVHVEDQVISINNIPVQKIFSEIYPLISAERAYFKNAQLENLTLPRFYWLAFGEQKEFEIEVLQNGVLAKHKLSAIKALEDYEMRREDILKHSMQLKILSNKVAFVRPGDFGGNLDQYKQFIDSSFLDIKNKKIKKLIIDLRNHSGGDDTFGDYLVSYIAHKPFKWASKFQLKTSTLLKENTRQNKDTTQTYWKSVLEHKNEEIYEYDFNFHDPMPKEKRFHGKVYVLVNRQSYSQSTVTAAQIQDYGFAIIVGEETGEFPNLYASIFNYKLPNTGISVDVSKGKINRINGIDNDKGVIPDIIIKDHLLDDKDEILEGLFKKLEAQ